MTFTVTRIKPEALKPPVQGEKRSWLQCHCGRYYYMDYIPYGLSNPVLTSPCGHDVRRMARVGDKEGMTGFYRWNARV